MGLCVLSEEHNKPLCGENEHDVDVVSSDFNFLSANLILTQRSVTRSKKDCNVTLQSFLLFTVVCFIECLDRGMLEAFRT